MKKLNVRQFCLALLMTASLSSYLYLHNAALETPPDDIVEEQIIEDAAPTMYLPDVALAKKFIEVSKVLLHPFKE